MRYLLPVLALVLCFTSCKKFKQKRACYLCTRVDSVKSNIPVLEKPAYYTAQTELCDLTEDQKDVQMKIRSTIDTTYNSGDTLVVHTVRFTCEFDFEQDNSFASKWDLQLKPKH